MTPLQIQEEVDDDTIRRDEIPRDGISREEGLLPGKDDFDPEGCISGKSPAVARGASGAGGRGVSVVVPVYNEEENVAECYRELRGVLENLGRRFEMIFVDDGSRDGTVDVLLEAGRGDPCLRVVEFRRNFGQTAAMAAGFEATRYDVVVPMDGDLQNDPAEIPKLLEKLDAGYDLVAGWRRDRQDKLLSRRLPSAVANRIISASTDVRLHDYGCTLKAIRGDVARGIRLYGEMHRFIPALAAEMGARITEVPVNHRQRRAGKSKYGISRTVRVVLDLLTVKFLLGYSKRPIHLFGTLGLGTGFVGFSLLAYTTFQRIFRSVPMGNRPMMTLGVMLCIIGLQFLVFGLLAEMLARTYYESQDKRTFVVRRVVECGDADDAPAQASPVRPPPGARAV